MLRDLVMKLALELSIVEPGKDIGLLPINCFLLEIEERLQPAEAPAHIAQAVQQARRWVDSLFDTSAVFDVPTIAALAEWNTWMTSALDQWKNQLPPPALPVSWGSAAAEVGAVSILPENTNGLPVSCPSVVIEMESALTMNLASDEELLREFINESQEHLQNIENGVLVLEENPTDADTLNSIFRAFHTFKGGSGFLNLTPIKNLAHELESLLDAARQHKLAINSAIIDLILQGGDTLKAFVGEMGAQLNGTNVVQPIVVPTLGLIARVKVVLGTSQEVTEAVPIGNPPPFALKSDANASSDAAFAQAFTDPPVSPAPVAEKSRSGPAPAPAAASTAGFVKVDTAKLDSLIDLVGELVISESMVVQDPELVALPSRHLARNLAQLRRITSDLQHTAMSLRMVPIRATFQKMTRLVRDLAAAQHKQVQLVFSGEDTELDRNIVEELGDPLVHMIRNSADHGVEMPDVRVAKGKPALGTVHLRAFHRGGNIVIQITDDGGGLNKERILAKAVERGIVKPGETLPDKDIFALIFAAGFSTAEKVTDLSGRGVGMDVVRRNIEKLRGKIEIESVAGKGTTFSIYLPLTLAIIDGMIVSVAGERYIIPTLAVRESFRPRAEMISTVHEQGEMVNVRGRLSPLLRLHEYFNLPSKVTDPTQAIIVVIESGHQTRCLMVDELLGKQEVVIKSLGETLKGNRALAGGAVMGDGRVGLILDVDALVRLDAPVGIAA